MADLALAFVALHDPFDEAVGVHVLHAAPAQTRVDQIISARHAKPTQVLKLSLKYMVY